MTRFAKVWDVKRYQQIAMVLQHAEDGLYEIKVFFRPEGHGISSFTMAWPEDSGVKTDEVFSGMVMKDAIEIVDKFMAYSANGGML